MTTYMKKIIYCLLALLSLNSCSDNWLKPDPQSFFAPENIYVDEAGFEALLVTLRKNLSYDFTGGRNPMAMEFAYSDVAVALVQSDFTRNTPSTSTFWPILTLFNKSYEFIKNANVLISRIDNVEWESEEVRNRLVAEAYWHRAYWYYRLVNSYGDVPWIGEELSGAKLDFQTYSRDAILKKLQQDLEFSVQWLPEKPRLLGDVTKATVNQLLTKIYLANREFDKAVTSSSQIINGPYSLMKNRFGIDANDAKRNVLWDLHRAENKNNNQNTETIYTTIDRAEAPPATWSEGAYTMRNYTPSWWKILDGKGNRACNWDTPTGDTLGIGNGDVRTNSYFHYSIWEENGKQWNNTPDLRRADINWVEMTGNIAEIKGCLGGSPYNGIQLNKVVYSSLIDTTDTWYPWPHYKTYIKTPNTPQPYGGQGDMYIYRLAETYLLRAEAHFWKGNLAEAANDINVVRARANAPLISAADVTIDYIFDERARELYIEEPRHSEMVRVSFILANLNQDGYNVTGIHEKNWYHDRVMRVNEHYHPPLFTWFALEAKISPYHFLWPVPQSVITANTLGIINQNKGYEGSENNAAPIVSID